jgi:predicted transcriptional regulator
MKITAAQEKALKMMARPGTVAVHSPGSYAATAIWTGGGGMSYAARPTLEKLAAAGLIAVTDANNHRTEWAITDAGRAFIEAR